MHLCTIACIIGVQQKVISCINGCISFLDMSLVETEIKRRRSPLTVTEVLGDLDTNKGEPTPKHEPFTYQLASIEISEVSVTRLLSELLQ